METSTFPFRSRISPRLAGTSSTSATRATAWAAYSGPLVYWMLYRLEHKKVSSRASTSTTPQIRL